jgi:hypothetical protein
MARTGCRLPPLPQAGQTIAQCDARVVGELLLALAVAGQVELGRQPAAAAAEPLVGGVLDPLFTSA